MNKVQDNDIQDKTAEQLQEKNMPLPFPHCDGCPYCSHGFICWSSDGSCMRTWQKNNQKRKLS